jgi:small subunit ribosomal protein S20
MPHTKSAKKRLRQNLKRKARNRAAKKQIKLQTRSFLEAVKAGDAAKIQAEYNLAAKRLDKAAARRVIHPNTAARKKSKLALKMRAKPAETAPAAQG